MFKIFVAHQKHVASSISSGDFKHVVMFILRLLLYTRHIIERPRERKYVIFSLTSEFLGQNWKFCYFKSTTHIQKITFLLISKARASSTADRSPSALSAHRQVQLENVDTMNNVHDFRMPQLIFYSIWIKVFLFWIGFSQNWRLRVFLSLFDIGFCL